VVGETGGAIGVCADTWWWVEIDLHVAYNNAGQLLTRDLQPEHCQVPVQFKCSGEGNTFSETTEITIIWAPVPSGGGYCQQHEKVILDPMQPDYACPPQTPPTYEPALGSDYENNTIKVYVGGSEIYSSSHEDICDKPITWDLNVVHEFEDEGVIWFKFTYTGKAFGADVQYFKEDYTMHVIKPLKLDVYFGVAELPTAEDWSDLEPIEVVEAAPWFWRVMGDAEYLLVHAPSPSAKTDWVTYRFPEGFRAEVPQGYGGYANSDDLYWVPPASMTLCARYYGDPDWNVKWTEEQAITIAERRGYDPEAWAGYSTTVTDAHESVLKKIADACTNRLGAGKMTLTNQAII